MFPEWPEKPFQEINPHERRKRIRALLETEKSLGLSQTEQAEVAKKAWIDRDGSVPNLREIEPYPGEFMIKRPGDETYIPASVLNKANVHKNSTDQIVLLRIQWDLADKELLNLFSKWLKANRPRPALKRGSVGGSNPLREKKKALERLGKVRIVKFSKGDYSNLFADQPQWIKCRNAVKDYKRVLLRQCQLMAVD